MRARRDFYAFTPWANVYMPERECDCFVFSLLLARYCYHYYNYYYYHHHHRRLLALFFGAHHSTLII